MMQDTRMESAGKWRFLLAVGLLLAARLWIIPSQPDLTASFNHDSAYITRLAQNLNSGNGFVNDALFLTFLDTGKLPIAFHNANPLYPILIATTGKLSGVTLAYAGVALSVTAHTLSIAVTFLLLRGFGLAVPVAAAAAILPATFISAWRESFAVLPDAMAMFLALLASLLVARCAAHNRPLWMVAAGFVFGLAWLTRSTAILVLPAWFWLLYRTMDLRAALRAGVLFAVTAAIVCAPWLWHTYQTWGSALRSDGTWYGLQDFYTRHQNYDTFYMWFSPTTPASMGEVIAKQGSELVRFVVTHIPVYLYTVMFRWFPGMRVGLVLFVVCILLALFLTPRRSWRNPYWQAGVLLAATPFAALMLRPVSHEARYLNLGAWVLCTWMAAVITAECYRLWKPEFTKALAVVTPLAAMFVFCLWTDLTAVVRYTTPQQWNLERRDRIAHTITHFSQDELVASDEPYFWPYFAGRRAISPSVGSPRELAEYLQRHKCRWLHLQLEDVPKFSKLSPVEWRQYFHKVASWPESELYELTAGLQGGQ